MAKTTIVEMTGFVEWAKIFPENMDDNMEFHAATEGQFNKKLYKTLPILTKLLMKL